MWSVVGVKNLERCTFLLVQRRTAVRTHSKYRTTKCKPVSVVQGSGRRRSTCTLSMHACLMTRYVSKELRHSGRLVGTDGTARG